MERIEPYQTSAKISSREEFVKLHHGYFLVKRPSKLGQAPPAPKPITYATVLTHIDTDPFANEWRLVPIKKREGNPYPERITIGRATNCDVVVRLPSVSKLHALIIVGSDGSFNLQDNQAANETFVNGRKLASGTQVTLALGDAIAFGTLNFEFVDAATLYKILRGIMARPI